MYNVINVYLTVITRLRLSKVARKKFEDGPDLCIDGSICILATFRCFAAHRTQPRGVPVGYISL